MTTSTSHQPADYPITTLFRHNLWSNLRLLDACLALDETQLTSTVEGTYGTLIDTLRHIISAEQSYVRRLTGQEPTNPFVFAEGHSVAEMRPFAITTGEGLIDIAQAAAAGDTLTLVWSEDGSVTITAPAAMLLAQSINHSTEHRTHVATILTQLGIEPPGMDGWYYLEAYVDSLPGD